MKYALPSKESDAAVTVEVDGLYFATQKLAAAEGLSSIYINNSKTLSKGEQRPFLFRKQHKP